MDEQTCLIDGFGPLPTVRPDTVSALGGVVREAAAEGTALYPVGGRTMLHLGLPPSRKGRAVDLCGLARVIDFPARDMTITVEAGITVAQLRDIVGKENLRLPIDVARADKATLGGTLAVNTSGPRRYGFGTLRDYVIGISAVNDAGNEFKAGGRVVKNVAGYDLCKLLVGSLGTLAIITQVTLKLRPKAEEQALVTVACATSALDGVLDQLHASRTRPTCLELLNRPAAREVFGQAQMAAPEGAWALIIGYEGNSEVVQWQIQQLVREIGGGASLEARVGFTAALLWEALAEWNLWPDGNITFKATLLPSTLARFCQADEILTETYGLRAHAGNGIVHGHLGADQTLEQTSVLLRAWRELAGQSKGNVVVERCPPAWKNSLAVWGPPPVSAWLMHDIKNKFDPRRVFNPGRFVDGI